MDDRGAPISYLVLEEGTPVFSADGRRVGRVRRVLAVADADLFDGLIIDTDEGERFVDAPHVGPLHERAASLTIDAADLRHLPEPTPSPAAMEATPDDAEESDLAGTVRRAWDRISGNY